MEKSVIEEAFWKESPEVLMGRLNTTAKGLTSSEAADRLSTYGPNVTTAAARRGIATRVGHRLSEPLVAILLIAATVSGVTGDLPGFLVIVIIVLFSIGLDVSQEIRAETASAALQASVAVQAMVLRDGVPRQMAVTHLVPGDIVRLGPGNLIPADGITLSDDVVQVNESVLTGEPYPVPKRAGEGGGTSLVDAPSGLFAGGAVISGTATMLVVTTGRATRLGHIAHNLADRRPAPAFERGLRRLGLLILRLTALLVLFVLLAHLAFHRPPLESFLFAVALAVGLTPELLPMVTTVTLSRGALRMARRKVVVKRLAAIHDLGGMNVLCTDKTGTLTEARITMSHTLGPSGGGAPQALTWGAVNAALSEGTPTPLDAAILSAAPANPAAEWHKLSELPFDFERRRSSVAAVSPSGRRLLIVKGAPESVLSCCTSSADAIPFDLVRLRATLDAPAADGLRLLAVAYRELGTNETVSHPTAEHDLCLVGACCFLDPPKLSASAALSRLAAQGVKVKVLSGDAAPVVRHVVASLGLVPGDLLTGEQVAELPDQQLRARVREVDLFARLSPDEKRRVVLALKAAGYTVGFLGDGINDTPSIHEADVGISVDDATEVARAAADMILLDADLGVLADGVEEGRRTFSNVMKYVRMGISSNFGNMLSMAVASVAIPFLPLLPAQVLLNNLLYDLSELGIPFDRVEADEMAAPHGWEMRQVVHFMLVLGPLSSAFDLATFALLRWAQAAPAEFRTAWFLESMATQILVIFLIRCNGPVWQATPPHPVLLATSLGALGLALLLALGPLAPLLGFAPIPVPLLTAVAGLTLLYLAAAEATKRWATNSR